MESKDLPYLIALLCLLLAVPVYILATQTQLAPMATTTTTTLQQVNSLLVKLNPMGNDTVCYNLPQLKIPRCDNGTKTYVTMPTSMACTTINGTIQGATPVVLMEYNETNVWGPPINVDYLSPDGTNSSKQFTPSFQVIEKSC